MIFCKKRDKIIYDKNCDGKGAYAVRKILQRVVSFIIAVIVTASFALFTAPSLASGSLSLSVSDAECVPGGSVTLSLDINENTGVYAFWIMIYYDPDVLTLTDVIFGEGISMRGSFFTSEVLSEQQLFGPAAISALEKLKAEGVDTSKLGYKIIMFEGNDTDLDVTGYGNIALLSFGAAPYAAEGTYTVGIVSAMGY